MFQLEQVRLVDHFVKAATIDFSLDKVTNCLFVNFGAAANVADRRS